MSWEKLAKTDAKYTKKFTRKGGFSGTDINPAYRLKRMTEVYGEAGVGWGWVLEKTWRETFPSGDYVFAQVNLWTEKPSYLTGAQIGGTAIDRTPDEAYKMAITDALGKCMLALGVCADVYLGEFDSKYSRQQQLQKPPTKQLDNPTDKLFAAFLQLGVTDKMISGYVGSGEISPENMNALRAIYTKIQNKKLHWLDAVAEYETEAAELKQQTGGAE